MIKNVIVREQQQCEWQQQKAHMTRTQHKHVNWIKSMTTVNNIITTMLNACNLEGKHGWHSITMTQMMTFEEED